MILVSDCSLYTGISTDVERRFRQHQKGAGAKYFHAGRRPERVVFLEPGHDRSSASKREAAIKKLPRSEKLCLIGGGIDIFFDSLSTDQ